MKPTQKGYTLVEMLVVSALFMLMILGFIRLMTFQGQMLARSRTQQTLHHQASYALRHIRKHVAGAASVNLDAGPAGADGRRSVSRIELLDRDGTKRAEYVLSCDSVLSYEDEIIADKVDGLFTRLEQTEGLRRFDLEVVTADEVAGDEMKLNLVAMTIATHVKPVLVRTRATRTVKNFTLFQELEKTSPGRKYEAFYDEIQMALDEARDGDEIRCMGDVGDFSREELVECPETGETRKEVVDQYFNGVFQENIELGEGGWFRRKREPVILRGGYDHNFDDAGRNIRRLVTTIDGSAADRRAVCVDGLAAGDTLVIDGFTITGGFTFASGSGIGGSSISGSLIISNNHIVDNGVRASDGCVTYGYGPGAYISVAAPGSLRVINNIVENNNVTCFHGGMYIMSYANAPGEITVMNNTFKGNSSGRGRGGGIGFSLHGTAPLTFSHNLVQGNHVNSGGGAGVRTHVSRGAHVFFNNIIEGNTSGSGTTGITLGHSSSDPDENITFLNNTVRGNNSDSGRAVSVGPSSGDSGPHIVVRDNIIDNNTGGGLSVMDGNRPYCDMLVHNNIISNNTASAGGGISISPRTGPIHIRHNTITGNHATNSGGGIRKHGSAISPNAYQVYNNFISNNTSVGQGGGIWNAGTIWCYNNIISENQSLNGSNGAVYTYFGTQAFWNNTIAYNTSSTGAAFLLTGHTNLCPVRGFNNNIIFFNTQTDLAGVVATFSNFGGGAGNNLNVDPLFNDLSGGQRLRVPADFELLDGISLCIDAGNNTDAAWNDLPDPQSPGNALYPSLGTVTNDMGAFGGPDASRIVGADDALSEHGIIGASPVLSPTGHIGAL